MNITQEQNNEDNFSNLTLLDTVLKLIELEKKYPNDMQLGERVRELVKSL